MNEEKKSGSWEGNWTPDSSNFSKAIGIWPKRYNHLATQTCVHKSFKLENWSIFNYISLNKGSKIHFWPLSSNLLQIGPMPSWCFWKNATFHIKHFSCQILSSKSILALLGLIQRFLDQFWNCLQILKWFMPKFLRNATILHVNT